MVELVKELSGLIKDLPEFSIWILLGILFYKVVIVGSWLAILRLLILKCYDLLKPLTEPKPKQVYLGDILCMVSELRLKQILLQIKRPDLDYLHEDDVAWLDKVIKEAKNAKGEK